GNLILLNGQWVNGGSAVELEVAHGGNLYADNSLGWWEWNGSGWISSPNPTSSSPDGSTLMAGSTGSLVTNAGTWTFSPTTNAYGNLILLNGQWVNGGSVNGGSATELEVAHGGNLYADNSLGWWEWNGSGWISSPN